jgi:hypothetical protein
MNVTSTSWTDAVTHTFSAGALANEDMLMVLVDTVNGGYGRWRLAFEGTATAYTAEAGTDNGFGRYYLWNLYINSGSSGSWANTVRGQGIHHYNGGGGDFRNEAISQNLGNTFSGAWTLKCQARVTSSPTTGVRCSFWRFKGVP